MPERLGPILPRVSGGIGADITLAVIVVGLRQVEGDEAADVPGQDRVLVGPRVEPVEGTRKQARAGGGRGGRRRKGKGWWAQQDSNL